MAGNVPWTALHIKVSSVQITMSVPSPLIKDNYSLFQLGSCFHSFGLPLSNNSVLVRRGKKNTQSGDQTSFKQTPRLAKVIRESKRKQKVKLFPRLSEFADVTCFILHTHVFVCTQRACLLLTSACAQLSHNNIFPFDKYLCMSTSHIGLKLDLCASDILNCIQKKPNNTFAS